MKNEALDLASGRAWRNWAIQSILGPWIGPVVHYSIARHGRSDADEILGFLFIPFLYLIFGAHFASKRWQTLEDFMDNPRIASPLKVARIFSGISIFCLAAFEAGAVLTISVVLFGNGRASDFAGIILGFIAYLVLSGIGNFYYVKACTEAINDSLNSPQTSLPVEDGV